MIETLNTLRTARAQRKELERTIERLEAPHKQAMADATEGLREILKQSEQLERELADAAHAEYEQANAARTAELLLGYETPAVPLPEKCAVSHLTQIEVSDPDVLPRYLLQPNMKAIKTATKLGPKVPGVETRIRFSFTFR